MNLLPSLTIVPFALAGLAFAVGPLVIHLLNRRRYRTVSWAAMDFLREALQRNRRILELRDLLLLLLRTAAVLLFGLALARPYFAVNQEKFDGRTQLHAVLLIDNSMSMGYESLQGPLLEQARQRARKLVEQLPQGSLISVVPLCGSPLRQSADPFLRKQDALSAIEAIPVVDRQTSVMQAMNQARRACLAAPELAKRVILLSDQQRNNWSGFDAEQGFADLPSVQLVDVGPSTWENSWISAIRVQDGVADLQTPTTIIVDVRYQGDAGERELQVALEVEGTVVASRTVRVPSSGGVREVVFEHRFQGYSAETSDVQFLALSASITPDRLPADDRRSVLVPVVASLPVVFVDQYGAEQEDRVANRLGETRHLRSLLAPGSGGSQPQLIEVRHLRMEDLRRDSLADVRLVVIAGVRSPGDQVELLREYVEQGGQLVLAAGGEFDPALWNQRAWQGGQGILPAPLDPTPLGALPEEAGARLQPFLLDTSDTTLQHPYFAVDGIAPEELRDLYAEPFFFKALQLDVRPATLEQLLKSERAKLEQQATDATSDETADDQFANDEHRWLLWRHPRQGLTVPGRASDAEATETPTLSAAELDRAAQATLPRVIARFDHPSKSPFLIERDIGQGTTVMISSGLLSQWNTLAKTNAILLLDRMLRSKIRSTLPIRNYQSGERIVVALPSEHGGAAVRLQRPEEPSATEMLETGFVDRQRRGVTIESALVAGVYRLRAVPADVSEDQQRQETLWETAVGIQVDPAESELDTLPANEFTERFAQRAQWIGPTQEISLAGSQIRGQNSWRWLIAAVLLLLLLECIVLLWPAWQRARQPA